MHPERMYADSESHFLGKNILYAKTQKGAKTASAPPMDYVYSDKNCTKKVSGDLLKKCFYEGLVIRVYNPAHGGSYADFLPQYLLWSEEYPPIAGVAITLGPSFGPDVQIYELYSEEVILDENEVLNNEQSN